MYLLVPAPICFEFVRRSDSAENVEAISATRLLDSGCSLFQIYLETGEDSLDEVEVRLLEDFLLFYVVFEGFGIAATT